MVHSHGWKLLSLRGGAPRRGAPAPALALTPSAATDGTRSADTGAPRDGCHSAHATHSTHPSQGRRPCARGFFLERARTFGRVRARRALVGRCTWGETLRLRSRVGRRLVARRFHGGFGLLAGTPERHE